MQGVTRYNDALDAFRLSGKAATLVVEIGFDEVATATSFIEYVCEKYGVSRSGAWYCLKKLKKAGLIEFTEKGESYKPLSLTPKGVELFRQFRSVTARADGEALRQVAEPREAAVSVSMSKR